MKSLRRKNSDQSTSQTEDGQQQDTKLSESGLEELLQSGDLSSLMTWGIDVQQGRLLLTPSVGYPGDLSINVLSAAVILRGLPYLVGLGFEDITIEINTDGGEVDQGFAMIDMIEEAKAKGIRVHTLVRGCCYSMGVALLQAGTTRGITKYSSIMVHDGEASIQVASRKARKNWQMFHKLQDKWYTDYVMAGINKVNPSFQRAKLIAWMESDTIFTAEEAFKIGFVDYIVGGEAHAHVHLEE